MKHVFLILLLSLTLSSCTDKKQFEDLLNLSLEEAYFEGQKDVIEGDIRIKKDNSGDWIWTKSPWDNGRKPIFVPKFQKTNKGCKL